MIKKKDTLCIIPARSGSKGIKNKNIIFIKKKPLFLHSLEFAKKLSFIKEIIFSTDSIQYLGIARKYGYNFNSLRPKKLSLDKTETIDVIKYEIKNLSKKKLEQIKFILILQPTCPFRSIKDFKKAHKKLKKNYDAVLTIKKIKEHPERMIRKDKNGNVFNLSNKVNFKPRQNLEQLYIRAGSMYFFRIKNLRHKEFNLGKRIYGIEVKGKYKVNIDDKYDLKEAKKF